MIREYLVSEAMHRLGGAHYQALAIVSTKEQIQRPDGIHPGGVMTRVAIRIGPCGQFRVFCRPGR